MYCKENLKGFMIGEDRFEVMKKFKTYIRETTKFDPIISIEHIEGNIYFVELI